MALLMRRKSDGAVAYSGILSPPHYQSPQSTEAMEVFWVGIERLSKDEALRAQVENIDAFDAEFLTEEQLEEMLKVANAQLEAEAASDGDEA